MKALIKLPVIFFLRQLTKLFALLPLYKDKALFISYLGKQYSCNPKYISEYLVKNYGGKLRIVWAFRDIEKYQHLERSGIELVRYRSIQYYWYLMRCGIIVTNCNLPSWMWHRKAQLIVHTWHSGGVYKKVSLDIDRGAQKIIDRLCSQMVTYYLSSCEAFTSYQIRQGFGYTGKVLNIGLPRSDLFFADVSDTKKKVFCALCLPDDAHIAVYAPTFRDHLADTPRIDFTALLSALTKRFGGRWIVLARSHHVGSIQPIDAHESIINVSSYDDMQELMAAADVLISDYSSCIWDAVLRSIPCFLYVPDLNQYEAERSFYYPIERWPFAKCMNTEELRGAIENFEESVYLEKLLQYINELGSFERGKATEEVCDEILDHYAKSYRNGT